MSSIATNYRDYEDFFEIPCELVCRKSLENDELPEYREDFMRDRDRVLYSTAFRRLDGKTQIYTIGSDDHKRNRLTHTLEVAQISRTIAHALSLNEGLAEAIALGHDFGHTPFGHAGEEQLHSIMTLESKDVKDSPFCDGYKQFKEKLNKSSYYSSMKPSSRDVYHPYSDRCFFGFKHNLQSVRVAATLEEGYRDNQGNNLGLNLTNYTLWGMMHHSAEKYNTLDQYPNYQNQYSKTLCTPVGGEAWSFEAYVVEAADDIAQWHHDLEDAIRGNALPMKEVGKTILEALYGKLSENERGELLILTGEDPKNLDNSMLSFENEKEEKEKLKDVIRKLKKEKKIYKHLGNTNGSNRYFLSRISHIVINTLVTDLIETTRNNLTELYEAMQDSYPNKTKEEQRKLLYSDYPNAVKNCGDQFKDSHNLVAFSEEIKKDIFKKTIKDLVHHSREVERMNAKGRYIIRKLFEAYFAHPQQLPNGAIRDIMVELYAVTNGIEGYSCITEVEKESIGKVRTEFEKVWDKDDILLNVILMRRICDHIASMTDRYAMEEYDNLYG